MAQLKYRKPVSRVHIGSSGFLNRVKITRISSPIVNEASLVLRDGRTSKNSKSVAGIALSQAAPKTKK